MDSLPDPNGRPETSNLEKLQLAHNYLIGVIPRSLKQPKIAIICGSGLNGLSELVRPDTQVAVDYEMIPHFPTTTVAGHTGKLLFGHANSGGMMPIVIMLGRLHYYEGHEIAETAFPIRILKLLGVQTLIVTNAAGGLNSKYEVGDLVLLRDHINFLGLAGTHPLRGPNVASFGPRFVALSDAYDLDLRRKAHVAWSRLHAISSQRRKLHEGVYAFVCGPTYETRAECRMLGLLGADVVGMSSVPEIIVARHCGLQVLALSLVTNKAVSECGPLGNDPGLSDKSSSSLEGITALGKADHAEVLEASRDAAFDIKRLLQQVIGSFEQDKNTVKATS